jgi:hypothetical protein
MLNVFSRSFRLFGNFFLYFCPKSGIILASPSGTAYRPVGQGLGASRPGSEKTNSK